TTGQARLIPLSGLIHPPRAFGATLPPEGEGGASRLSFRGLRSKNPEPRREVLYHTETRAISSLLPVASAYRRSVATVGETRPLSSRATADWVVPSFRARSVWDIFAFVRARIRASITEYSPSALR